MCKTASLLLVVSSFLLALFGVGCNGGSSSQPNSPPKVMTTSLPAALVGTSYSLALQASGGTGAYTWSISSGSLPSWAQLEPTSGTIAGMPDTDGTTNFSVTVTDSVGLSDEQDLSLVVNRRPALSITTTSLPDGTVGILYSAQLQASGGTEPYTWSITAGSLPSWASLSWGGESGALIGGIPDASGTSNFTIEVTDSQVTPDKATKVLSVTIAAPDSTNNAELKGQYAFLLRGFDDGTGNQFAMVGSFIAKGDGTMSGLEDVNGPAGVDTQGPMTFTGTYNVGADNRGMAIFKDSLGTSVTLAIAVGSLDSSNVATRGSMIEFDYEAFPGTAKRGSGFFYQQDTSAFSLSSIKGPYAFQFIGQTEQTGTRWAVMGAYTADGNGNVTSGEADANADGQMTNYNNFTATIGVDGNTASFGRVRFSPTVIPLNYVCYIVSTDQVLAMSTDKESTAGLLAGEVLRQATTSFSAASLDGTSVGYGAGERAFNIGRWTFDASAAASYKLAWDDEVWPSYPIHTDPSTGQLSYTVSPNGRAETIGASLAIGVPGEPIFYLVDKNKGFLMSTDSSVATGFLEPQTGGPFSNASLSGSYFFGSVIPEDRVDSGVGTSSGNGTLNVTTDSVSWFFDSQNPVGNSWTYNVTIDGSGLGQAQDQYGVTNFVVYMISPDKFVSLANAVWPVIWIFQR